MSRQPRAIPPTRIDEALPLSCPACNGQMRSIAFINDAGADNKTLDHIGETARPSRIAPIRGPTLREAAAVAEQVPNDPRSPSPAQPAPCLRQCEGCHSDGFSANRDSCRPVW